MKKTLENYIKKKLGVAKMKQEQLEAQLSE
jgi:hypothetical protein